MNTVELKIRISDDGSFKKVEVDADDLRTAVGNVVDETKKLNAGIVNWTQMTQAIDFASQTVEQFYSALSELTSGYREQVGAETRLAQAMRNTMSASDEEIESIKQLAQEQMNIGIVDDDVQIAAGQELATYLGLSSSLKTLLPVMNDMIAQQLGYNATAESATNIASMLGKVMNGQTEALSRYGYKFNDAQKYILQYGSETQRVAVLAQVVEEAVGGMNEAMAKTDAGKLKQTENKIDDIKKSIGGLLQGIMPVTTILSQVVIGAAGVAKLATSLRALSSVALVTKVHTLGLAMAQRIQSAAQELAGTSAMKAVFGVNALRASTVALYAALTMGISVVIEGLIMLFNNLGNKSKDTANNISETDEATEAYGNAASSAMGEIAKEILVLEKLIKSHKHNKEEIQDLNDKYGEIFGKHKTEAEWYDTLTQKSEDYCRQLGYEAVAKVQQDKLGKALVELDTINAKKKEYEAHGQTATEQLAPGQELKYSHNGMPMMVPAMVKTLTPYGKLKQEEFSKQIEVNNLKDSLTKTLSSASEAGKKVSGPIVHATQEPKTSVANKYDGSKLIDNAKSYAELGNNIKYYQTKLDEANVSDKASISTYSNKIAVLTKEQKAIQATQDAAIEKASQPAELKSLQDIDTAINYQKKLRQTASTEQLSSIDAEINRLDGLKNAMNDSSHTELSLSEIKTYKQLQDEIAFYTNKLQTSGVEERSVVQQKINGLGDLKKKWDELLAQLKKPGDIAALNSMEDLDDAVNYYSVLQKSASGEEIAAIQKTINALNDKKNALNDIIALPAMQSEVASLSNVTGKPLRLKLELIGIETIESKIKKLQAMLSDTKNPLDSKSKDAVKGLLEQYQHYDSVLKKSDKSLVSNWSTIRGLGGGIKSLTQTLKGNGEAWDKVSGVVDSSIQIYEGIKDVIEIVKMLTGVTKAETVVKKIEGDTELQSAGKKVTATVMEIAASKANTEARREETTANVAVGASGFFAGNSGIPIVGLAVAAAMIVAMLAIMASLPKYANGGIAYGPTLGIFGEYSGAQNNPEVVAPLSKLRQLIQPSYGMGGTVVFKIQGRELRGVLEKDAQYRSRTV